MLDSRQREKLVVADRSVGGWPCDKEVGRMCVTVGEVLVTSVHKWIPVYDCMFQARPIQKEVIVVFSFLASFGRLVI